MPHLPALVIALLLSQPDWRQTTEAAARELAFHGAVLVQSHGQVVVDKALGDAPNQANRETRYWIASISKSFTATLIFRLQELGVLKLGDPVAKFFPDAPADKQAITIEQLLQHTSGLPNKYASDGVVIRTEAVKRILQQPLVHPPGKEFGYTNDGYSLLAAVAEVAGGKSYPQLLERHILDPAGMKSSGLWPVCPGRTPVLPLSEKLPSKMNRENWGYKGPDGICSTTADLAKFMNALIAGKILGKASLQAMWKEKVPIRDGHAAAGWFRSISATGSKIVWTRGTDHGHNSIINYYPEKDLILISLSSSKDPEGPLLARMLVNKLEEKLGL